MRLTIYLTDLANFPRGQRDHGGVLQGAVSRARDDRCRAAAARRPPSRSTASSFCRRAGIAAQPQIRCSTGRSRLTGVGPKVAERLAKLGVRHDRRPALPAAAALRGPHGAEADRQPRRRRQGARRGRRRAQRGAYRRRRSLLCRLADGTGAITLRFFYFNKSVEQALARGQRVRCYGEVAQRARRASRWFTPSTAPCAPTKRSPATA